jgi:hypothetical protein
MEQEGQHREKPLRSCSVCGLISDGHEELKDVKPFCFYHEKTLSPLP